MVIVLEPQSNRVERSLRADPLSSPCFTGRETRGPGRRHLLQAHLGSGGRVGTRMQPPASVANTPRARESPE